MSNLKGDATYGHHYLIPKSTLTSVLLVIVPSVTLPLILFLAISRGRAEAACKAGLDARQVVPRCRTFPTISYFSAHLCFTAETLAWFRE